MDRITPFLWFDNNLEEAMAFYTSVFKNAKVLNVMRNGKGGPGPEGSVLTATFQLEGQQFMGLNGGPMFKFTEAVSFFVSCETQQEIDYYWTKLTADGGQESMCGWLKDKFGLSWQIVPANLGELLYNPDPAKSGKAMQAMLKMHKLDIAELKRAAEI
jgi:predicted 3-demethylubiquinone-9 3-methyltransferase (glyoxalase superfamily)